MNRIRTVIFGMLLVALAMTSTSLAFSPAPVEQPFSVSTFTDSPFNETAKTADATRHVAPALEVAVIRSDTSYRSVVADSGKFRSDSDALISTYVATSATVSGFIPIGLSRLQPTQKEQDAYLGRDHIYIDQPPSRYVEPVAAVARSGSY